MTIIYRILGFIITFVAILFAISLIVIVPISISSPALWFPTFLIIALVLYAWFSNVFQQKVLKQQQKVKHSLRDWIRVNGFVALAFSILNIASVVALLRNPESYIAATKEMMKNFKMGYEDSLKLSSVYAMGTLMLVYMIALLVHVLWTFALIKKHKDSFE